MESESKRAEERRVDRRLSQIEKRLNELADLWNFAACSDSHYRMIEAERKGLRLEREQLREIKGDL